MRNIILSILLVLVAACNPIERIVYQDRWQTKTHIDSIYIHDIDSFALHQRGDTVFMDRISIRYRDRVEIKNDTITLTKTKIVKVEKELTGWQKFCIEFGKIGFGVFLLFIAIFILKKRLKKRSQIL